MLHQHVYNDHHYSYYHWGTTDHRAAASRRWPASRWPQPSGAPVPSSGFRKRSSGAETTKPKAGSGVPRTISPRQTKPPHWAADTNQPRRFLCRGTAVSQLPPRLRATAAAEAKFSERKSNARALPGSSFAGSEVAGDLQPTSKWEQDEARGRRWPALFPRIPGPLPREGEAAKEKVNFVPQPPEEQRAPRRWGAGGGRQAPRLWREAADREWGLHLLGGAAEKSPCAGAALLLRWPLVRRFILRGLILPRPGGVSWRDVAGRILERGQLTWGLRSCTGIDSWGETRSDSHSIYYSPSPASSLLFGTLWGCWQEPNHPPAAGLLICQRRSLI